MSDLFNVNKECKEKKRKILMGVKVSSSDDDEEETPSSSDTPEFTPETYYFTSYADAEGETEWGSGSVETTGVTSNGYTQVEVITNDPVEDFIGEKFYIASDAETDNTTLYPLYTDAGTTAAGIYVKISDTAPA